MSAFIRGWEAGREAAARVCRADCAFDGALSPCGCVPCQNAHAIENLKPPEEGEPHGEKCDCLPCRMARVWAPTAATARAEEDRKALGTLSMGLGNPCLEAPGDTTLSDALVAFALARLSEEKSAASEARREAGALREALEPLRVAVACYEECHEAFSEAPSSAGLAAVNAERGAIVEAALEFARAALAQGTESRVRAWESGPSRAPTSPGGRGNQERTT